MGLPSVQAQTAVVPTGGDGLTTATAYQITQLGHLVWLGERAAANDTTGKYYQLMNDLDALDTANWNDAGTDTSVLEGFRPIGIESFPFRGIFNGNGKKITGLSINRTNAEKVGLFGVAGYWGDTVGGRILNLTLENSSTTGRSSVGHLVGYLDGNVRNCRAGGVISGSTYVGGLVGYNIWGTVVECAASGTVTANLYLGGLVGDNYAGSIIQSSAACTVTGNREVGGLVGHNYKTIVNSFASGRVIGNSGTGGLVGDSSSGKIQNCFSSSTVRGDGSTGGLIGTTSSDTIENCFATGPVSARQSVGGLLGYNGSTIQKCFAIGEVTGQKDVGGLAGYNYGTVTNSYWNTETTGQTSSAGSDNGFGKTSAQMKQQAIFTGWDFTSTWGVSAGKSYPYLRFSPPPFRLSVTAEGPGTVSALPQSAAYIAGTEVALTAIPADTAVSFLDWQGVRGDSTAPSASILMDTHRSVAAHFRRHYEIRTLAELQAIASGDLDGYYTLMNDLDASDTVNWNDAGTDASVREGFRPIGSSLNSAVTAFRGVFEGNGKKIIGLVVNRPLESGIGLFGCVGNGGQVLNLSLEGGNITGKTYAGGLAGEVTGGTVENCYVTSPVSGMQYVGGLIGYIQSGSQIANCFETGSVTGHSYVGGLSGVNYDSSTSTSFASGHVTGTAYVGGLFGNRGTNTSVTACYWDRQTTGQTSATGSVKDGEGCFGRTTAEMKQMATFSGWDFASVWGIVEGQSYPYLRFAPPPFRLNVTVLGAGSVTLNPAGGVYAAGTQVTLTATPASGSAFSGWSG
ncbi:MAG TPA: GLUG motif-containing protein, partial [Candidatus Sumerlaeota bacterium]|nr:GLUG motif-containing protein [Candidatus Sumerlaeota bacterium]